MTEPSPPPYEITEQITATEAFALNFLKSVLTLDQWIAVAKACREVELSGGAGEVSLIMRPGKVPRVVTAVSVELKPRMDS